MAEEVVFKCPHCLTWVYGAGADKCPNCDMSLSGAVCCDDKKRLIIFDFDGVILMSSKLALREAYKKIIWWAGKNYRDFFEDTDESFFRFWIPNWHETEKKIGIKDKDRKTAHKIFYEIFDKDLSLNAWTAEIPQIAENYTLVIFSSSPKGRLYRFLGKLAAHFSIIVTANDVKKPKPDPEGIYLILNRLGFANRKSDVVLIDDLPEGIQAGRTAGIKTIAFVTPDGYSRDKDFADCQPDVILRSMEDLWRVLLC